MGHWLGEESALWEDPFAAFRLPRGKGKAAEVGLKPVRPDEGKALWREYNGLLLAEREDVHRPRVVQQIARLVDRDAVRSEHNLRFRCIGIRTDGKAKNFEWIDEALEVPPAILLDEAAAYTTETALARADEVRFVLESSFNSHFRPERDRGGRDEKLARFKSIRARMITTYWQQLAPQFRRFINDLATEATRDEVERSWVGTLHVTGKEVFTVASEQVGERANALRAQVEAQSTCFIRLAKKRKEWFGEQ
jgi:CRISPR system Cascade subunit CasA